MREMMEGVWMVRPNVDLVYSPDDEAESGKGYYLHRYGPEGFSPLFATKEDALKVLENPKFRWRRRDER